MADKWTEAENSRLLMQVIAQLKPEKGGIDWDRINIEGRTKKACQNTWFKFMTTHKQQLEAAGEGGGDVPPSPAKVPARKRKGKKEPQQTNADDGEDVPSPTKKPRARQRKPKVEDDVEIPSPDTIEDVDREVADAKPKVKNSI
ncbi:uncharacterized protein DNG_02507 [Cephalotrichum gorgonifer]|uniref:Myb-like domain-containing protein n=1 Tax=Cephalotrichum gorgonifer TaxID=2041049 RepID=A0AAE8MUJ6_9PEZI|nr:uncharacterized protein DNG_02507 [Cephalotrichum gorgonifer]